MLRHQFFDQTGSASYGVLVEWTPGVLFGTFFGGSDSATNTGGIFRYNLNTGVYEIRKTFFDIGVKDFFIAKGGLTRFGNKLYGATLYGGRYDYGFLYSYDPANNALDTLANFGTIDNLAIYYDSLRRDSYYHQNGWGTELLSSYDNRLYGLTGGSMFSYNPVDSQFRSLNSLSGGPTNAAGRLGFSVNYGRLLEICTPPYYLSTIPDTVHVFQDQPFSFTISTPNTDTFHWVKDAATPLPQQTDSTLHFDTTRLTNQGWYTCTLINECGDSTTKRFFLKVDIVTPLPFTLTGRLISSSAAGGQGEAAVLQWTDPAASNVASYELQRSNTASNFIRVTMVSATTQTAYTYTDKGIFASPNERDGARFFYRLKQISKDGKEAYSNIVQLNTQLLTPNFFTLSPNPAKDKLTVTLEGYNGKATLAIVDVKGAVLLTKTVSNGNNNIHLHNLPPGEYVVVVTDKTGKAESKKVVVE